MEYFNNREGVLGQTVPMIMFLPTTEQTEAMDWPDIQIHGLPFLMGAIPDMKKLFRINDKFWNEYLEPGMKGKDGISFSYCLLRPKSRYFFKYFKAYFYCQSIPNFGIAVVTFFKFFEKRVFKS